MFFAGLSGVSAQQDAQFTQYMYNTQVFNPAYVGTTRHTSVSALHRQQWVGVEGSPQTSTVSLNAPLKKGLGIGGTFIHDAIGVTNEANASVDIAYRLKLDRQYTLSMGIKVGMNYMSTNFDELQIFQPGEAIGQGPARRISPTAGAGVYYYSRKFYAGLSVPNFVPTTVSETDPVLTVRERIHANFIMGYVHKVNRDLKIKPAGIIQYVNGAPVNWQASTNLLFKDKFVGGLAYQWKNNASVLLGLYIKERTFIGYTYDFDWSALRKFNSGSHEVFLRINLGNLYGSNVVSPRFF